MSTDHPSLTIANHVAIQHFLTILRPEESLHNQYRMALNHIYTFLIYEAFRIMPPPLEEVEFELRGKVLTNQPLIISDELVFVAIMRGGMAPAAHLGGIYARASVAHVDVGVGEDLEPKITYERMPENCSGKKFVIIAPRIETGTSCVTIIKRLRQLIGGGGDGDIIVVNVVCAPQGIETLLQSFPDVPIVTASIESDLSDDGQVLPGIGWTGHRVYQTVKIED